MKKISDCPVCKGLFQEAQKLIREKNEEGLVAFLQRGRDEPREHPPDCIVTQEMERARRRGSQ